MPYSKFIVMLLVLYIVFKILACTIKFTQVQ